MNLINWKLTVKLNVKNEIDKEFGRALNGNEFRIKADKFMQKSVYLLQNNNNILTLKELEEERKELAECYKYIMELAEKRFGKPKEVFFENKVEE